MFKTVIETKRLILRPFTLDDVDEFYKINLDPEVTRYTHDGGVKTRDEIHKTLKENVLGDYKKHNYGRFAVVHKATNELIGFSGLKYLPEYNEVDLGYRFAKKYWGQGIATESSAASLAFGFDKLQLKTIVALTLPENIASMKVLTNLGFILNEDFYDDNVLIKKFELSRHDYFKNKV